MILRTNRSHCSTFRAHASIPPKGSGKVSQGSGKASPPPRRVLSTTPARRSARSVASNWLPLRARNATWKHTATRGATAARCAGRGSVRTLISRNTCVCTLVSSRFNAPTAKEGSSKRAPSRVTCERSTPKSVQQCGATRRTAVEGRKRSSRYWKTKSFFRRPRAPNRLMRLRIPAPAPIPAPTPKGQHAEKPFFFSPKLLIPAPTPIPTPTPKEQQVPVFLRRRTGLEEKKKGSSRCGKTKHPQNMHVTCF
mmetsp:Transcript_5098/g.10108  ORF Transcript_5098/g.10108 Transcript_5098/m.10108 type:complete len:252 (-) Transcript_5098:443-1198(-)